MRALVVVVALVALVGPARADTKLAALAPAPDVRDARDARRAVAIGPQGQLYEPDGHGAWIRRRAIGIAPLVTGAAAGPVVGVDAGPPFALATTGWTAIFLVPHAKAVLGTGPRPTCAVGHAVFDLRAKPVRLTDAPATVSAIGASAAGVVVATERGLFRLDHATWKAIAGAPGQVVALAGDRWALIDHGAVELHAGTSIAWPAGVHVVAATVTGDDLVVVGANELVTVHGGKIVREAAPIDRPVAVVADRDGRVVVALADGRLAVRDHGAWTTTVVRDELPAARPGAPPARSK